ncbi:MAG: fluoride efflux transporter CrcB [Bacteroidia bacterium]|nr:fluoride efflux transporter CrcB [Bacteroidia bacterium]
MNLILVIIGGGLGAVLRYIMSFLFMKLEGHTFPWSTFAVNVIGCFLIGILTALAIKFKWNESTILFIMTGLLGGFTTFSAFSLEFFDLIRNNHTQMAFIYFGLSNFVGIGLCALGYYLIK